MESVASEINIFESHGFHLVQNHIDLVEAAEIRRETISWPTASKIERIFQTSKFPIELLRDGPEDNVAGLIVQWYQVHLAQGGEHDPIADDLIAEAKAEDRAGQPVSYQPGRA